MAAALTEDGVVEVMVAVVPGVVGCAEEVGDGGGDGDSDGEVDAEDMKVVAAGDGEGVMVVQGGGSAVETRIGGSGGVCRESVNSSNAGVEDEGGREDIEVEPDVKAEV